MAFELKAIEIIFSGDSPVATKNRAAALKKLFPQRFGADFGTEFEPSQFVGPRYEAKLEVFKAACEKVEKPEEVFKIWALVFPGDQWIKALVEAGSMEFRSPSSAVAGASKHQTLMGGELASDEPSEEDGTLNSARAAMTTEPYQSYSNNF